jgi:hypothetical protein
MDPQDYNYTENFTLPYFAQYYIVQNYKNSNTKVFVYKHMHPFIL